MHETLISSERVLVIIRDDDASSGISISSRLAFLWDGRWNVDTKMSISEVGMEDSTEKNRYLKGSCFPARCYNLQKIIDIPRIAYVEWTFRLRFVWPMTFCYNKGEGYLSIIDIAARQQLLYQWTIDIANRLYYIRLELLFCQLWISLTTSWMKKW